MITFISLSDAAVQSSEINGEPTDLEVPIYFLADESSLVEPESADEFSDLEVPYAIRTKRAAGASRCSGKFPKLEVNTGKYGDICRAKNGKNYRCPKGCYKTRNGKVPFCQMSKNNKSPCREKSGETVSVYTVKESSFCHTDDKIAKHADLEEAQAACSAMGEECKSITSYGCSGDYIWTCSAAPREPSSSGSCSWIKGTAPAPPTDSKPQSPTQGERQCRGKFPTLKKNTGTKYGDICRSANKKNKNFRCPVKCSKTSNGKAPFCQMSVKNKSPCRVN